MNKETRNYKITGTTEQLNVLEELFNLTEILGDLGSARTQKIFIDGDGAIRLKFARENGERVKVCDKDLIDKSEDELMDTSVYGYGVIKKLDDKSYYFDLG